MENIIGSIILGFISAACFVLGVFQFNEKGYLLNNAYIFASEQEREAMNKKPYYRQSGTAFLFIGVILLIIAVDVTLKTGWLFYCAMTVSAVAIIYAIISTVVIERRKK